MTIAKTIGALVLSHASPEPRPVPTQIPAGPMMKAVTGIMMMKEKNGTNTICTLAGMSLARPL